MCLHTMGTYYFQFMSNYFVHRDMRRTLITQHKADLDMFTAFAQTLNRVQTSSWMAKCIDGNMNPSL